MATERDNHLDDGSGRQQEQVRMGGGTVQPSTLAGMDSGGTGMGLAADELGAVGGLHKEPCEMDAKERQELERAIWRACWTCMITFDEANAAIAKFCK